MNSPNLSTSIAPADNSDQNVLSIFLDSQRSAAVKPTRTSSWVHCTHHTAKNSASIIDFPRYGGVGCLIAMIHKPSALFAFSVTYDSLSRLLQNITAPPEEGNIKLKAGMKLHKILDFWASPSKSEQGFPRKTSAVAPQPYKEPSFPV